MLSNRGEFKQKASVGHFAFFFPVVERDTSTYEDFSPVDTWNYPAAPPDGVHLNNS
ncbi:hypothetical protein cypCar_00038812 [Cyprinus carpio]|nr:hypothetical protein cypCar_00038812 [Cyprinus carpio]